MYLVELADTPLKLGARNQTKLHMMISSSTLSVQREVFALSFQSLVADIGGVLGLFIGFNFLSFWEISVVWLRQSLMPTFN